MRKGLRLARAMGWMSLGLAGPQLLMPERVNRMIGIDDTAATTGVMRAVGMQEALFAGAILSRPAGAAGWLWGRVAGDVLHLAMLSQAATDRRNDQRRLAGAATVVTGALLLDTVAAVRMSRSAGEDQGLRARGTITVNRPPEEVYRHWRDLANLPGFMWHLESVTETADGRSHWVAKAPAGRTIAWDAAVVRDIAGELISWRSVGRTAVPNEGSVRFRRAPKGTGTEVTVDLRYDPPGGRAGAAFAKLFGEDAEQQVRDDLRRFKQVMETGEVVRSEATPEGTRSIKQLHLLQRPAQPAATPGGGKR